MQILIREVWGGRPSFCTSNQQARRAYAAWSEDRTVWGAGTSRMSRRELKQGIRSCVHTAPVLCASCAREFTGSQMPGLTLDTFLENFQVVNTI